MATLETITLKVEKLLRMAADREGTAEGDVFRDKAFELMAQYGVEKSQLNAGERATAERRDIDLVGTYTDMQFMLLNALGTVLHSQVVMFKVPRSSKVSKAVIFGRPHHVERAIMLYGFLSTAMIAGATTMTDMWPDPNVSVTTRKRSWMTGFISEISARLRIIEADHTEDYGQAASSDGSHADSSSGPSSGLSGALVLQKDRELAEDLAREHFPFLRRSRSGRRTFDAQSFHHGAKEGQAMDLGQTRVGRTVGALPRGNAG